MAEGATYSCPLVPMLRVEDADASASFYSQFLGFEVADRREEDGRLVWARLRHGETALIVSEQPGEVRTNPGEGPVFCLYPDDVVEVHTVLVEKGVTVSPLRETEQGVTEFELVDPDGYELRFGTSSATA